MNAQIRKSHR